MSRVLKVIGMTPNTAASGELTRQAHRRRWFNLLIKNRTLEGLTSADCARKIMKELNISESRARSVRLELLKLGWIKIIPDIVQITERGFIDNQGEVA